MHRASIFPAIVLCVLVPLATAGATENEETPARAYARGCGGCHTRERTVLRAIPRLSDEARRAWIAAFVAEHPNEYEAGRVKIIDFLVDRSRP